MRQERSSGVYSFRERVALLFPLGVAATLAALSGVSGAQALVLGVLVSLIFKSSLPPVIKPWNSRLLGAAIVLMGASTPFAEVLRHGTEGLGLSAILIAVILMVGIWASGRLGVDAQVGTLVSSGTAICGGSAIAAAGPAIGASAEQTGIAIAVVFLLNAVSVFLFPPLGHFLGLSPESFGRFAALAIHDTSSVLAASVAYGGGAELAAVPMKLARALWIVPRAAILGAWWNRKNSIRRKGLPTVPWFIPAFVIVAATFSGVPALAAFGQPLGTAGKRLLVATLYLIGNAITGPALKKAGLRPLVLGLLLWAIAILSSIVILKLS